MNQDTRMNRRRLLAAAAAASLPLAVPAWAQHRVDRLVLGGPMASVSNPLIRMVQSDALADVAGHVEFAEWKDPDQLRALALGGQADFMAMPSNVAANLYNRGVPLKLLDINTWGILSIVSRDEGMKTLADLVGKELVMPFRGDMPDIIFQTLAEKQGLRVGEDIRLRYVATPIDAMQLLLTRRADQALLAEPAISMAFIKSRSLPVKIIAPQLYRSVDLQAEWGRVFDRDARIPQAGIVVLGQRMEDAALIQRFEQAHAQALQWCSANADACGRVVAERISMLTPEGVADSIRAVQAEFVTAADARPDLEFFYQKLAEREPGLIGGKLPGDDFYYGA